MLQFILGVITGLLGSILWSALTVYWRGELPPWRLVMWRILFPGRRVRVSVATLLMIQAGGKYLLVEGDRRRGEYGPVGGVRKLLVPPDELAAEYGFVPDQGSASDSSGLFDLRGTVPARRLLAFVAWTQNSGELEAVAACGLRELGEESSQHNLLPATQLQTNPPQFRELRRVWEGPYKVEKGKGQLRHHTVVGLVEHHKGTAELLALLRSGASGQTAGVEWASRETILGTRRTASGHAVGAQARYLVGGEPSKQAQLPPRP